MRAIWNGEVIADSDDTVVVEGNHYFPAQAVRHDRLQPSDTRTTCGWRGVASNCHIVVGDAVNRDAVWFYPDPLPAARHIAGRYAFWRGVRIEP